MPADEKPIVFFSHSRLDDNLVNTIAKHIPQDSYEFWIDHQKQSEMAGSQWRGYLRNTIRRCTVFVVLLTPHVFSKKPNWVENEYQDAYELNKDIVPLKLSAFDLNMISDGFWGITSVHFINVDENLIHYAATELDESIKRVLGITFGDDYSEENLSSQSEFLTKKIKIEIASVRDEIGIPSQLAYNTDNVPDTIDFCLLHTTDIFKETYNKNERLSKIKGIDYKPIDLWMKSMDDKKTECRELTEKLDIRKNTFDTIREYANTFTDATSQGYREVLVSLENAEDEMKSTQDRLLLANKDYRLLLRQRPPVLSFLLGFLHDTDHEVVKTTIDILQEIGLLRREYIDYVLLSIRGVAWCENVGVLNYLISVIVNDLEYDPHRFSDLRKAKYYLEQCQELIQTVSELNVESLAIIDNKLQDIFAFENRLWDEKKKEVQEMDESNYDTPD